MPKVSQIDRKRWHGDTPERFDLTTISATVSSRACARILLQNLLLGPGLGYQKGTYKTYFSAPRAERIEGDTTVFDKAPTRPASCKDNPDRPPLWRVRAKRIIHKNDEKMIYYEDAWLSSRVSGRLCAVLFGA